ncbi:hypothetical protein [Aestuariibaculum sediminum]|uniref:Uncharacterized protein n=1 Tax=Aestuariibaculum sediminum TaxID=2770637 RepID=A0A8J6U6Y8_9FLAO|nr:hypothetical protein [Aestuariibaculum sediminum]MBD0831120.1 hypothetical protein [Aestuariibaculum sediminum]
MSFAQNNKAKDQGVEVSNKNLGYFAYEYALPITTGDNFTGLGLKGKFGVNLKLHVFVYKGFFVSGTAGAHYFKVKDKSIVGNYEKTTAIHQYLSVGYEIEPVTKLKLGVSAAVLGRSRYKNKIDPNNKLVFQTDRGRIRAYDAYIHYMLVSQLAVYINYTYRNDHMNIQTAAELNSIFDNASFHTIGFGFRFCFGKKDLISTLKNNY